MNRNQYTNADSCIHGHPFTPENTYHGQNHHRPAPFTLEVHGVKAVKGNIAPPNNNQGNNMNQDNIPADIFAEGIRAMPKNEARDIFDQCIQNVKEDGADPELIAKLEVAREFFCDRQFAKLMMDFAWEMNN